MTLTEKESLTFKKTDKIYVFKTSINTQLDINKIRDELDRLYSLTKWSFDLEDCDRVFRVETSLKDPTEIIQILQDKGFHCEEMPY